MPTRPRRPTDARQIVDGLSCGLTSLKTLAAFYYYIVPTPYARDSIKVNSKPSAACAPTHRRSRNQMSRKEEEERASSTQHQCQNKADLFDSHRRSVLESNTA